MASALRPLFVTVTWGASGSTSGRSLELADLCQRQLGLTTCLHLTCTNMHKYVIDEALREAKEIGIRNILALRGDPPRGPEYTEDGKDYEGAEELVWAADLVRYIRKEYGDYFCIGVAGYPEGHSDESNPTYQDPKHDLPYLVDKVQAGGDFIMTQLFYDEQAFFAYEKLVREWDGGVLKDVPIIPGLMPIQSFQVLKRVTKLSHASLPPAIADRLEPIRSDDEAVKRAGIDILSNIVSDVQAVPSPLRRGFHFYTLNLEKMVSFVLERTGLIPPITPEDHDEPCSSSSSAVVVDGPTPTSSSPQSQHFLPNGTHNPSHQHPHARPGRRPSSPHNHITTDAAPLLRSPSTSQPPSRATNLAIAHGVGAVGREATWDDYPNGRFGDARSPAFGEIDGYGGPMLHASPRAAREIWGQPTSREQIGDLFVKHLQGGLERLPWSEGPLNAETRVVEDWLVRMVRERCWWSVASQPAVDGARSNDKTFGWGPKGGFVFQKPFVEFWIPREDWLKVLRPRLESEAEEGRVSWYAMPNPLWHPPSSSNAGLANIDHTKATQPDATNGDDEEFDTSSPPDAVHSVTWGSFPGKEIISPTIIEGISFRAWADEAFGVWREWERCYPPGSRSREVVRACADDVWLVNVIGHVYQEPTMLWELLLGA